jgi:hypothetical protein
MTSRRGSIPKLRTSSLIGTHIIVGDVTQAHCSSWQARCSSTWDSLMQIPRTHTSPFPRMFHALIVLGHDVAHVERIDITESNDGHQSIIQEIVIIFQTTEFLGKNVNFCFVD